MKKHDIHLQMDNKGVTAFVIYIGASSFYTPTVAERFYGGKLRINLNLHVSLPTTTWKLGMTLIEKTGSSSIVWKCFKNLYYLTQGR